VPDEIPHVKVTINDLYREQQETNKLLIQLASELKGLSDLPGRVRDLEVSKASIDTSIKDIREAQRTAKTAIISAIIATGTAVISFFK
jgi:hypothetical protein